LTVLLFFSSLCIILFATPFLLLPLTPARIDISPSKIWARPLPSPYLSRLPNDGPFGSAPGSPACLSGVPVFPPLYPPLGSSPPHPPNIPPPSEPERGKSLPVLVPPPGQINVFCFAVFTHALFSLRLASFPFIFSFWLLFSPFFLMPFSLPYVFLTSYRQPSASGPVNPPRLLLAVNKPYLTFRLSFWFRFGTGVGPPRGPPSPIQIKRPKAAPLPPPFAHIF